MDNLERIKFLEEEIEKLRNELTETKEHLKKYTAPKGNKVYYEKNREKHIKNVMEYRERTNYVYEPSSEKKKQYARTAYLNSKAKKEKLKQEQEEEMSIEKI